MLIKQAVVLAAGFGTRLGPVSNITPKPLARCSGRPFLSYLLDQFSIAGIEEVIIISSYLGVQFCEFARSYMAENPKLKIKIEQQPIHYETGRRCAEVMDQLQDHFLLCYGDNFAPINLGQYLNSADGTTRLVAYKNARGYSTSNLAITGNNVDSYSHHRKSSKSTHVNLGYYILSKSLLPKDVDASVNIESIIFSILDRGKQIKIYECHCKYYSVSNMDRLRQATIFFSKRKFIFIDRDGVINYKLAPAQYVLHEKQLDIPQTVGEALSLLRENNFTIILITNQPAVGKGLLSKLELSEINSKMNYKLSEHGGRVDYVYACLHDWNDGCDCRKPRSGLFLDAQHDLDLNLSDMVYFGDQDRDREAAENIGVKFIKVDEPTMLIARVREFLKEKKDDN